jgi:aminocarboxymuconate-semialdehyde decarboxylase
MPVPRRPAGTPLDDPGPRAVLAAAADLGVPLILHPYYVGARPGLADFYLTNLIGNPLATTVGAARLIFSGALDDLPALRLVLTHGGGYLPYQIGRLDHGYRVRPESRGCAGAPSAYPPRFWFDTVTHAPGPLRFLTELVGADHVVYGTDYPFDMAAGPLTDQLAGTGLAPADTELIAGRNAAALFGVPGPAGLQPQRHQTEMLGSREIGRLFLYSRLSLRPSLVFRAPSAGPP